MEKLKEKKTDTITQIIYTSTAVVSFSKEQLKELLIKARKNNHSLLISGMLVHDDGFFIQVLEGPEKEVNTLFAFIEKDPRHKNVRILLRHKIKEKEFEEWSMGFVNTSELTKQIEGFIPYSSLRNTVKDKTHARKVIQMFQEGLWRQAVKR